MKEKKALKGMTLVEIIISLAIFALLGLILVQVGTLISSSNKATSRLKKKITVQSPYAASRTVDYVDYDPSGAPVSQKLTPAAMNITVSIDDNAGNPKKVTVKVRKSADSAEYENRQMDASATIAANRYNTLEIVDSDSSIYDPDAPNDGLNLKFAVIEGDKILNSLTFDMSASAASKAIVSADGYVLPEMDSWLSSNPSIAMVDNSGNVTPVSAGTCEIYGYKKGVRYVTNVTVV